MLEQCFHRSGPRGDEIDVAPRGPFLDCASVEEAEVPAVNGHQLAPMHELLNTPHP